MKEELRVEEEIDVQQKLASDVDADDARASGMLGRIGRGEGEVSGPKGKSRPTMRTSQAASPFLLESLYFRSFGARGLLSREEEILIAKRVDQGTRRIRAALRQAIRTLLKVRRIPACEDSARVLQSVRRLSGLSATALDNAEKALNTVLHPSDPTLHPTASVAKPLQAMLDEIRAARIILEQGKDELVRCNLRLVVDVAKHYTGRGLTLLDLVQEGNIGLMKAAERYQYRKGFKFSTYA
ncbi:MAG: sigma factor, partial [Nitrospira sp.]